MMSEKPTMELFQDISNQHPQKQHQPVLKTFERRRRVATIPEGSAALSDDDDFNCSPSTQQTASCSHSYANSPTAPATVSGLSKRGRRSSVLRGAALPGHLLFSSHVHTSRSLLLAKMSKARRKAYLAYTQQMAEYFAEVDQFELVVESPTAATDSKARSRLPAGSDSGTTPMLQQQQYSSITPAAADSAEVAAASPLLPASALHSATPASAAPSHNSSILASEEAAADSLWAASPEPVAPAGMGAAHTPTVPSHSPASSVSLTGAAAANLCAVTPAASQPATPAAAASTASPLWQPQSSSSGSSLAGATQVVTDTPAELAALAVLQAGVSRLSLTTGSSSEGPSLAASTPAGQDLPSAALVAAAGDGAASDGGDDGSELLAATPANLAGSELQVHAASQAEARQQSGLPGRPTRSQRASSSGRSSLAAVTPAAAFADATPISDSSQHRPSQLGLSLVSSTPAATQQADMQQLMQQMQDMLLAATTPAAQSCDQALPAQQLQQGEEQGLQCAGSTTGAAAAAAARKLAGQQHKRSQKQKQHQKAERKNQTSPAAAADVDVDADIGITAAADELQRQVQEQAGLAEQHYQAWLQRQAQEAAAAELKALELEASADAALTPLQQMLKACGQQVSLQDIPSMRDFLADVVDLRDVVKIGEGTYGEAFKSGQVVFKFVPMEGPNLVNGWPQKGAADLLGEAIIALALTDLRQDRDDAGALHASYTDAFVQTHRVGVCRGPYPAAFIKAWKAWDKRNKSENDAIGGLPDDQLYAVFAMANCGRDLEGYQLQGYEQVRSLMLQTALALAVAEEALAFEHRDLHWGNIMLSPPEGTHITARLKGCSIRVRAEGARVRLIDFTASRLQTPGGDVVFCDLEAEYGIFDGPKGQPQFETYRRMRKLTRKDWAGNHSGTNVLWMLYLTELLLSSEKPIPGATAAQKRNLREFKKRLGGYNNCSEVICDELFEGLWASV